MCAGSLGTYYNQWHAIQAAALEVRRPFGTATRIDIPRSAAAALAGPDALYWQMAMENDMERKHRKHYDSSNSSRRSRRGAS